MAKTDGQYIDYLGLRCPYCHSEEINPDDSNNVIPSSPTIRYEPMKCTSCGEKWLSRFKLVGWDEIF
ncbi:MAG TPA: hypothetical protein EYP35_05405 [Desulfobacterales bacterium]|nr:hypothetical protein [Desulfobacterales bacterium]